MESESSPLVGAVDQGTSSSRFLIFSSKNAELVTYHQTEINQLCPQEGWVEEDPKEILQSVITCMEKAVGNLKALNISSDCIKCIGITNQRETTVVWDKVTGEPLHNAIIWLDLRTASTIEKLLEKTSERNKDHLRGLCGLPITTYFSAVKLRWLLDNCPKVAEAARQGRCLFGTVDSWLLWNFTGGKEGGKHITDVTNASRTMLMNIHDLKWDQKLCSFFDINPNMLPEIRSSAEVYGSLVDGPLKGTPISGILGDQQAALVGQLCFKPGQAKNTYGTGCFLLMNTGLKPVESKNGLLTTVGYQLGKDQPVVYALEGAIAIAGACVRWLRDNIGIIKTSEEIEELAKKVTSTYGCYFVPAFSGLFCPYWQSDARGIICGLSQFTIKEHIARAALEAVCFQTRELLEAMLQDSGIPLKSIQVDGGMTANSLLMQLQADLMGIDVVNTQDFKKDMKKILFQALEFQIAQGATFRDSQLAPSKFNLWGASGQLLISNTVGIDVVRPSMPETTALGAAMAAGSALGIWNLDTDGAKVTTDTFTATITEKERDERFSRWKQAVERSMHWVPAEPASGRQKNFWDSLAGGLYIFTSFAIYITASLINQR